MFKNIKQYLFGTKNPSDELTDCEIDKNGDNKMDIPGNLPIEILHEILLYMSPYDLHNMRKCCRKWRNNMTAFWKKKCKMEGYFECEDDLNSDFYRKFVSKYSKWEGIYLYNSLLEDNWITNNFKEVIVNFNRSEILPFTELKCLSGDVYIVTLKNNNILVIDCTTGLIKQRFCLSSFKYNRIRIRQIGKFENRLMVVSETKMDNGYSGKIHIKVWNIETGSSLTEFRMEIIDYVHKISVYKNLVTVLTSRSTAKIININKKKLDYERNCISSVCYGYDRIAMGTDVGTIIILNLDYTELMTLSCFDSNQRIDDIEIEGNYLIGLSRSEDTYLFRAGICNTETKTKLYTIERLWRDGLRIYINKNKLVYLCPDGETVRAVLKYCHLDSGNCILENYSDTFVKVTSHNFFILHESLRGKYKLWSIKTENIVGNLYLRDASYSSTYSHELLKTKSKLAYFDYAPTNSDSKCGLKIINFEAPIYKKATLGDMVALTYG